MSSRPPLVAYHGFTGCGEALAPLTDLLAECYQINAPDLPGHGVDWTTDDAVADCDFQKTVTSLAQTLPPKSTVVGYSMGGRFALGVALAAPEKVDRLVLVSTSPGLEGEQAQLERSKADENLAKRIRERGIQWFVNHWASLPMWASQESLPGSVKMAQRWLRLSNNAEGLARSLEGSGQGVMPNFWDRLSDLNMPVEIVAGKLDPDYVALAKRMTSGIPSATLHMVAGSGHAVHLEDPQALAKLLLPMPESR